MAPDLQTFCPGNIDQIRSECYIMMGENGCQVSERFMQCHGFTNPRGGGGVEVKVKGLVLGNRPFSARDTIGQKLRHVKS